MNAWLDRFKEQGAIDLLAFLGEWPDRRSLRTGPAELSAMAARLNLRAMCVSHLSSVLGHDTRTGNIELFAEAKKDERLWPFPVINPMEQGWQDELAWAAAEGARGVRLVPGYHGYGLRDITVAELLGAIRLLKLPLQVCVRLQDERLQHPRLRAEPVELHELAELTAAADGHPLLISGLRDHERETVMRHASFNGVPSQLLFDLWFCNGPLAAIASLCRSGLTQSYGYSSCSPLHTAEATALQLSRGAIEEAERADLCYGNAMRLFGFGKAEAQRPAGTQSDEDRG
ncbi:hypothetical protein [Paenibacillus sp. MBLB4367]|uniref:hypothetical protein n=1 Tax=Paenibacillus sp. MBLB4367 TaxID=3384767 RepID=UPI00390824E1